MPPDDKLPELLARYQGGEEESFVELYQRLAGPIGRYLRWLVGPARADDLVQETFLQVHRARRTYRPELPARPWIYAIARHVAQSSLRRHGRKESLELALDATMGPVAEGPHESIAAKLDLERALRRLPAKLREPVWLAEVEGWTSVEIARLTGASAGVVRVRLQRARQKLKDLLVPME